MAKTITTYKKERKLLFNEGDKLNVKLQKIGEKIDKIDNIIKKLEEKVFSKDKKGIIKKLEKVEGIKKVELTKKGIKVYTKDIKIYKYKVLHNIGSFIIELAEGDIPYITNTKPVIDGDERTRHSPHITEDGTGHLSICWGDWKDPVMNANGNYMKQALVCLAFLRSYNSRDNHSNLEHISYARKNGYDMEYLDLDMAWDELGCEDEDEDEDEDYDGRYVASTW